MGPAELRARGRLNIHLIDTGLQAIGKAPFTVRRRILMKIFAFYQFPKREIALPESTAFSSS